MKFWVKVLLGTVLFGGGFASGYFCHKKLNDVKFEEVTPEEMDILEKSVASEGAKGTDEAQADIPATPIEEAMKEAEKGTKDAQVLPENPEELQLYMQGKKPYIQADKEQKMAYEKLWKATKEYSDEENADQIPVYIGEEKPLEDEEDDSDEFIKTIVGDTEAAMNDFDEPPHVIDLAAFYNERPEYDKITINWYEPDNVWLDEHEDIIGDIGSYIGTDGAKLFGADPLDDDPDVRFIRNMKYGTDYEIIRHHRSYRETIGDI